MEEKKIRRRYDREFKEDAVRLVIEGGSPLQGEHPMRRHFKQCMSHAQCVLGPAFSERSRKWFAALTLTIFSACPPSALHTIGYRI